MSFKIKKDYSPNQMSRRGWKPDMIVSHITSGNFSGAVSWLKNKQSQASSHFVISRKGEIVQLVDIEKASWCNGTAVSSGAKTYYGKANLEQVKSRKTNANYYTVTIEHEGFGGQPFTDIQIQASIWLQNYIRQEVKRIYGITIPIDRNHIVGHYQINPITKPNCPGNLFPFDRVIKGLNGGSISIKYGDRTLSIGMQGEDVKELQNKFIKLGYDLKIDGTIGKNTEDVIYEIQKIAGIKSDGYCGQDTFKAIEKLLEVKEMIQDWQKKMGEEALDFLQEEKIVDSKDDWKKKLGENTPNWLLFSMLYRILNKENN